MPTVQERWTRQLTAAAAARPFKWDIPFTSESWQELGQHVAPTPCSMAPPLERRHGQPGGRGCEFADAGRVSEQPRRAARPSVVAAGAGCEFATLGASAAAAAAARPFNGIPFTSESCRNLVSTSPSTHLKGATPVL